MGLYTLTIDATKKRDSLSDLERGAPIRIFRFDTLSGAKAARNIGAFASGATMSDAPRKLAVDQSSTVRLNGIEYTIARHK